MQDIRLKKFIEMFYDHTRANLDCELRETCPALKDLGELLIMIKENISEELALELELVEEEANIARAGNE